MATLLFRMRGVPDDEVQEIRELLDQHHISYYETKAGNWGISMPALWIEDSAELPRARELLDHYQHERATRMRAAWQAGERPSLIEVLRQRPIATLAIIAFCLFIVYVMLMPFIRMAMPS